MAGAIERAKAAAIKVRFFMRSPSNERSGFPVANRFGLQAEIETDCRKIVQSVKLSTSDEQGDMGAVGLSLNLRRLRRISCRMAGPCRPPRPRSACEQKRTPGPGEQARKGVEKGKRGRESGEQGGGR